MTTDLAANYDTETNISDVEKKMGFRDQKFEGEANSTQLDKKHIQRSNLNSKYSLL